MLVITVILGIPNDLLLFGSLFLIWIILGNIVAYFYPKLWFWVDNQYLQKQGLPINQKGDKKETANPIEATSLACKLSYFGIEFGLIFFFFSAAIVIIVQQ